MIVLADIFVYRAGRAVWVVIVAHGNDKSWIPAFDKICYIRFVLAGETVIPYNGKDNVPCL